MKQWTTTEDFIANGKIPSSAQAGFIVQTKGYSSKGDGGGAQWKFTGVTGQAASQSPVQTGKRLLTDASGSQFQIVLAEDGSFNDSQVGGLVSAAKTLEDGGYLKVINSASLSEGIVHTCSSSVKIVCSPDVSISAGIGFSATKLLQFGGGGVADTFEFYGGNLKGGNVPLSGAGEANDLLYVTSFNKIIIDNIDADCEFGSDSCLFTADYDFCYVNSNKFRNAPDAGLYTSGPSSGSGRGTCFVTNNYSENCGNEGYTAKRNLERFICSSNVAINCATGIATAEADGISAAQYVAWSNNIIKRCTNSLLARLVKSGAISDNNIYEVGRNGGGSSGVGILLQGSSNLAVTGNTIDGWNPDNSSSAAQFDGYKVEERLFNAVTTYSTFNNISGGSVKGIGKVVREGGSQNERNIYGPISADSISGTKYTVGSSLSVVMTSNGTGALIEWLNSEGRIAAVQPTTNDDETYFIIKVDQSGGPVVKRVKQGAPNSGPGGSGRALFVDN